MNLKKPKKKKKIKYLIYLSFIYIAFAYTFYYMVKDNNTISNEKFINMLVSSGNANILSKYKTTNIVNSTMKLFLNIDFTNPQSILNTSILKFGESATKEKSEETIQIEYNDDYSNMEELEEVSDYISDPNPTDTKSPIIYLYNTHQLENYSNENLEIYGITPNVQMASYVLREKLNSLGLPTIVEEANMSDILDKNGWDYSYSYQASRQLIVEKINNYKSLKYVIDIHRDSISKNLSTTTINNKNYAKVLFVIGLDHNNWQPNYNFANDLNNLINQNYNGLSRGILKKTGPNVNGVYNQDISNNSILIEVGGVDNTIEEVYNTMEALSTILYKYIKGD